MDNIEKAELITIGILAAWDHDLCEHTVGPLMTTIENEDGTAHEVQRENAALALLEYFGLDE